MIRWLWSRMMKWGWDFNRDLREDDIVSIHLSGRKSRNGLVALDDFNRNIDLTDPIEFRVQAVQGGTLVETRWTNSQTEHWQRKLHIVTADENLAEAIGKIVTMELLKR